MTTEEKDRGWYRKGTALVGNLKKGQGKEESGTKLYAKPGTDKKRSLQGRDVKSDSIAPTAGRA